jgi:hypothetical protein
LTLSNDSVIVAGVAEWTLAELADRAARALAEGGVRAPSGRVTEVPDPRLIRWYTTIGLLDRPTIGPGRIARYGQRHLLQLVAVKRLQAQGLSLAQIQQRLAGATDDQLRAVAALPTGVAGPAPTSGTTVASSTQAGDGTAPAARGGAGGRSSTQGGRPPRGGSPERFWAVRLVAPPSPVGAKSPYDAVGPDRAESPVSPARPVTGTGPSDPVDPAALEGSATADGSAASTGRATAGGSAATEGRATAQGSVATEGPATAEGTVVGPTPASAMDAARVDGGHDTVARVHGVRLGGLTLLLPAEPAPHDLDDIAAAARPLLDLLADRGLLDPHGGNRR